MPRKPDRFERAVEDLEFYGLDTALCESRDVIDLLRKEHAWMVWKVKRLIWSYEQLRVAAIKNGYDEENKYALKKEACEVLLQQLAQRRK